MNHTYTTTAQGIQVPMGDPEAKLHFARVNTTNTDAQVWECRTIHGRHLSSLRMTFTSRFTDKHVHRLWFPGEWLYREMIKQEAALIQYRRRMAFIKG